MAEQKQKVSVVLGGSLDEASFSNAIKKMQDMIGRSNLDYNSKAAADKLYRDMELTIKKIAKYSAKEKLTLYDTNELSRLGTKLKDQFDSFSDSFKNVQGPDFSKALKEQIAQYEKDMKAAHVRMEKDSKAVKESFASKTGGKYGTLETFDTAKVEKDEQDLQKKVQDFQSETTSKYYAERKKEHAKAISEEIKAEQDKNNAAKQAMNLALVESINKQKALGTEGASSIRYTTVETFLKKRQALTEEIAKTEAERIGKSKKEQEQIDERLRSLKIEADLMEKIANPKTSLSPEAQAGIINAMRATGNPTTKKFGTALNNIGDSDIALQQKKKAAGQIAKDLASADFQKEKAILEAKIVELQNALNAQREAIAQLQAIVSSYAQQSATAKAGIDAAKSSEMQQFADDVEEVTKVAQEGEKVVDDFGQVTGQAQTKAQSAAMSYELLGKKTEQLTAYFKQFISTAFLLNEVRQLIAASVSKVKELDESITQIAVVSDQTTKSVWESFSTFNKAADELSTTTSNYLQGAKIFYQQGLNTAQVMEMVAATTINAALGEVDFTTASETLTAAINGYNKQASEAMEVTDKLAAVGAKSAADFNELSTSMKNVASSAYTAGIDFDHLMGYLAKGIETTREAPEAIGTALKTVIARFEEMKVDPTADLGEGIDANRVETALKSIGVSLRDASGEFRDLQNVFDELGGKWKDLSRNQKAYIATMAAGSRQQSRFMAIMNNYDRTLQLVRTSQNSAGAATQQYGTYMESIEAKQLKMNNALEAFQVQLTSSDAIKGFYDGLTGIINGLNQAGPIVSSLTVAIAALGVAFVLSSAKVYAETVAMEINTAAKASNILADKNSLSLIPRLITAIMKKIIFRNAETTAEISATAAAAAYQLVALGIIGVLALVVIGIAAAIKAFDDQANAVHKVAAEKAKLAEVEQTEYTTLKSLYDRYEELKNTVNRTAQEQSEYLDIIKQISAEAPNLVKGIDAEGNAILDRNEAIKAEIRLRQQQATEAQTVADKAAIASMQSAKWNSTLDKGAPGQKTVDASEKLKSAIKKVENDVSDAGGDYAQVVGKLEGRFGENLNKYLNGELSISAEEFKANAIKDFAAYNSPEAVAVYKQGLDDLFKQIEDFTDIRVAESRQKVAGILYRASSSYLEALELANPNTKFSDEYRNIVASFATSATQAAENYGKATKQDPAKAISIYSQGIQESYIKELENLQKQSGFNEAIQQLFDLKKSGASADTLNKAIADFQSKFKTSDTQTGKETAAAIAKNIFNVEEFNTQVKEIATVAIPNGTDAAIAALQNSLSPVLSKMSSTLSDFIFAGINNIDDAELKQKFINKLSTVFDDKTIAELEATLARIDMDDPAAVAAFTQQMTDMLTTSGKFTVEEAKTYAEAFISQTTQVAEAFLTTAKKAYDELSSLNDMAKKSASGALSLSDAFDLMKKSSFGAGSITGFGDNFFLTGESIENTRREKELELANQLASASAKYDEEIKKIDQSSGKITVEQAKQIELLNNQKESLAKIYEGVVKVSAAERARMDNQSVLTGISAVNSTVSSLKDLGSVYNQLTTDGMSFLDTLNAIGDNPDLLQALDITNGKLTLSAEKMRDIAAAKKDETITFLTTEKAKIDALISVVDTAISTNSDIDTSNNETAKNALSDMAAEQEGVIATASLKNDALGTQVSVIDQVSAAEFEKHKAFMDQTRKEIDILNARAKAEAGEYVDASKYATGSKASITGYTKVEMPKTTTKTDLDLLLERYGIGNEGDRQQKLKAVRDKLANESASLGAIIAQLGDLTPTALLESAGGKKSGGGDKFDSFFGEFDKFFNYLERLKDIATEITSLTSQQDLDITGGFADLALMKQQNQALADQAAVTQELIAAQKAEQKVQANQMKKDYSGFVSFDAKGQIKVRWDLINALEITNEEQEKWYNGMLDDISAYTDLSDSIDENTQSLIDNQKAREELYNKLRDEMIETQQNLYDALVEADQKEIDELQKKYDKMTEIENEYLNSVKNAITKERDMRSKANSEADLEKKRRRLAVLQRDTSGVYSQEAAKLQSEIDTDRQALVDQKVDAQLQALEDQLKLQQEQRDLEIQNLQTLQSFKEENGLYWEQVNGLIADGPEAIAATLMGKEDYLSASKLEQTKMASDIQNQAEKISGVYTEGKKALGVSDPDVASALSTGLAQIAGKLGTSGTTPTETGTPVQKPSGSSNTGSSNTGSSGTKKSSPGSSFNPDIKALQEMLSTYGYFSGYSETPDGKTGPNTKTGMEKLLTYIENVALRNIPSERSAIITAFKNAFATDTLTPQVLSYFDRVGPSLGWPSGTYIYNTLHSFAGKKYKKGGLVDYTGPAEVHGTTSKPEAFLNSRQTDIFAGIRDILAPANGTAPAAGLGNSITIGDIIVNVEGGESETLAQDIGKAIREEIFKAISGRINLTQRLR